MNGEKLQKLKHKIFLFAILLLSACKAGFEPIDYGKEACAHCKMTIVDPRFACEFVTAKGRVYKFDDVLCMKKYTEEYKIPVESTTFLVAEYYGEKDKFINAANAVYLKNELYASPMNGNMAAFNDIQAANRLKDSLGIQPVSWSNIQ